MFSVAAGAKLELNLSVKKTTTFRWLFLLMFRHKY